MIICILVEDQYVEKVRNKVKSVVPNLKEKGLSLRIPVSSTGNGPATHWFCFFNAKQKTIDTLIAAREYSIMEVSPPNQFLHKHGLKILSTDKLAKRMFPNKLKKKQKLNKSKQNNPIIRKRQKTEPDKLE